MHKDIDLTQRRWVVLAVSCLVNLCAGSLYAWSVFSVPMSAYLRQFCTEIPDLAAIFVVANGIGPVTMISGGYVNDKLGPRWVLFIGGLLLGGGMTACGLIHSFYSLLLSYGFGVGLGVGLIYGTVVSNVIKFFPDHRGIAGGLTTAIYGGSSVLIPPVANILIQNFSISQAFIILGVAMLFIICISSFFILPCPKNFTPTGWAGKREISDVPSKESNYRQMISDPIFYLMLLTLLCGALPGLMIISQASPMAQNFVGSSASQAALAVSVIALFNTCGRIAAGTLSDKIGVPNTLIIAFCISSAALLLMAQFGNESVLLFHICISLVGFSFGSVMGVYPGFTAFQFGSLNNSVNYGIMFIGFAFAGIIGPMAMGYLYTATGQYEPAFYVSAILNIVGLYSIIFFKKTAKKH